MVGTLVAILVSWAVMRFVANEPLSALGLVPTRQRLLEFLLGLMFMAMVAMINSVWQAQFKDITYVLNPEFGIGQAIGGSWWILNAVVYEEFLFRGALLFLLIRYIGPIKACLLSSIAFGIYHWFSYGVIGERAILLIYIFLVTGAGGWMFAYAFAKTKSMFAPIGLHLGWNLITAMVFSSGPIGNQLLIQQNEGVVMSDWGTLLFFTLQTIIAPGLVTWYLVKHYKSSSAQQ